MVEASDTSARRPGEGERPRSYKTQALVLRSRPLREAYAQPGDARLLELALAGVGPGELEESLLGLLAAGVVLVLGLCACLLHFYFSTPHNKPMRTISRIGVLVLMLSSPVWTPKQFLRINADSRQRDC